MAKVPVSERALLARVNRELAKKGDDQIHRARGATAQKELGAYYLLDAGRQTVKRAKVDLEEYARSLGVLADYEALS